MKSPFALPPSTSLQTRTFLHEYFARNAPFTLNQPTDQF